MWQWWCRWCCCCSWSPDWNSCPSIHSWCSCKRISFWILKLDKWNQSTHFDQSIHSVQFEQSTQSTFSGTSKLFDQYTVSAQATVSTQSTVSTHAAQSDNPYASVKSHYLTNLNFPQIHTKLTQQSTHFMKNSLLMNNSDPKNVMKQ